MPDTGGNSVHRRLAAIAVCAGIGLAGAAQAQDSGKPDPRKADQGESIYNNHCQTCHGENLVSTGQTSDLRQLEPKDRQRFQAAVEKGKGQMPPWKGVVSDEEIEAIWHYIMSRRS